MPEHIQHLNKIKSYDVIKIYLIISIIDYLIILIKIIIIGKITNRLNTQPREQAGRNVGNSSFQISESPNETPNL